MYNVSFMGKREDRNTVEQLKKQGDALTLNNQRNINEAIGKLAEDSSEENIKFLMNVAQGLRYGTSFELDDKKSNNEWKAKLQSATQKALDNTNSPNKEALKAQFDKVFVDKKALSDDEKAILSLRDNLLKTKGLPQAMQSSNIKAVKNIAKNLDYFVISTEVSTEEKKACLEGLNKLMSSSYKIDPQLKDKKPQVLGELLNDLVVKTADETMPTIKTTDQRHHGMCAAISMSRKAMAYEYKSKYVNQVMEELSSKPTMQIYDITKLGTGKKVDVEKTPIDYDYADDKGYRILDAAALQWMHIADGKGDGTLQVNRFSAFDKEFFDTFHDGHYMADLDDPKLVPHQYHLRALTKAKGSIDSAKKGIAKREKDALEQRQSARFNAQTVVKANKALASNFAALMPDKTPEDINKTVNQFLKLGENKASKYYIVDAEEEVTKKEKMANFIKEQNPNVDAKDLDARMKDIFNMYELSTETTEYMNREIQPKSPEKMMRKHYQPLYEAAAMFRTATLFKLDIPEELDNAKAKLGLPKEATKEDVIAKYENTGVLVPEKTLRSLQDKYNKIAKYAAVVEKAEVKGEKLSMDNLYVMSKDETTALDRVEKNLNKMASDVKREYLDKSKMLEQPLAELAKATGQKTGSFWVNSEGESGLCTPQQIRIMEQMTGKPAYEEEDIDKAAEIIKKSGHSGTSSTSVYHNQQGGHAQYVADVAPLLVKNPETGKYEVKDAIMHDNTWGACEHKKTWLDSKGLLRTDYQCGRGGEGGYITNDAWQNGTLIEDFKNKYGMLTEGAGADGSKFKLFRGMNLSTDKTNALEPAESFAQTVFIGPEINMSRIGQLLRTLENVNVKNLDKIMARAENAGETASINEKMVNNDLDKVNSEQDYNKLSDKSKLKQYMKQISQNLSIDRESADSMFNSALSMDVKAGDIDKLALDNRGFKFVKDYIDEKYDTKTNEDFIQAYKYLQNMDDADRMKLISSLSDKQVGVSMVSEYDCVKGVKAIEPKFESALKSAINMDSIKDNIKLTEDCSTFEENFFMAQRDWGNLDTAAMDSLKAQYLKKYGVRSAIPEARLTSREETNQLASGFTDKLNQAVEVVTQMKAMIDGKLDKQGLTDEQLNLAIKNQLKDVNEAKKVFIEANIAPKDRNKVLGDLNNYLSAVAKNKPNKEAAYNAFEESFSKSHILNHPKDILREFVKLSADPQKEDMAKVYESYVVKGCYELTKLDAAFGLMSVTSNGHAHKMGGELKNIKIPEGVDGAGTVLSTPTGLYKFLDKATSTIGVDNTIAFLDQTSMHNEAMRVEAKYTDFKEYIPLLNRETIGQVAEMIENKAEFVSSLKLEEGSKESKLREAYIGNLNKLVEYINANAEKIMQTEA